MAKKIDWSSLDDELKRLRLKEKLSIRRCAERLGVAEQSAYIRCIVLGINEKVREAGTPHRGNEEFVDAVVSIRRRLPGASYSQIANQVGLTRGKVAGILKRYVREQEMAA